MCVDKDAKTVVDTRGLAALLANLECVSTAFSPRRFQRKQHTAVSSTRAGGKRKLSDCEWASDREGGAGPLSVIENFARSICRALPSRHWKREQPSWVWALFTLNRFVEVLTFAPIYLTCVRDIRPFLFSLPPLHSHHPVRWRVNLAPAAP